MKPFLNLVVVICCALAASSNASAKGKKTTLADFKGSYTGTVTVTAPGVTLSGPLSLAFSANKSGKTGSVNVNGSISSGMTTVPVRAVVGLTKGAFSIDNFVFNTLVQGSYPGFGSYTVGKNKVSFQGAATVTGTTYPFSGTILTRTKGRKQTLIFTTVDSISGTPYVFTFTVSRKLKKSEL